MAERRRDEPEVAVFRRWRDALSEPTDVAVIVYFRIAFGLIAAWEMWRFLDPSHRWVAKWYTDQEFYFSYPPFEFVQPLPSPWLHAVFWLTGLAGLMVAAGAFYRWSATALFLGLAYIFLLDEARYLNHFYLVVLVAFLMIWIPADRAASFDARRRPEMRSQTTPLWALWILRFQVAVPYFFGGIAKINSDWLRGEPMRAWLASSTDVPLVGGLFVHEPVVWAMTYGALFFDLLVVAALMNRRARPWAFLAAIGFHLMNSRLFGIGVFPWIMMAMTLVFFDPSWPRLLWSDLRERVRPVPTRVRAFYLTGLVGGLGGALVPSSISPWKTAVGFMAGGVLGFDVGCLREERRAAAEPEIVSATEPETDPEPSAAGRVPSALSQRGLVLILAWVAVQVLMPLRHFAVPGNVHWTEEGHNFAWHMKLRDKSATAQFFVTAGGQELEVESSGHLSDQQFTKMSTRPHMIVEYAHYLEDRFEALGFDEVAVRAEVYVSLNGRDPQLMIDPTFDLTTSPKVWFGHADWITPLYQPLKPH